MPATFCATIAHNDGGRSDRGEKLMERISTATYNACRNKVIQLDEFPDFGPLVAEMQRSSNPEDVKQGDPNTFKVTVQQPGGNLVVKEQFFQQFADNTEFEEIVAKHNENYNPEGSRLRETVAAPQRTEPNKTVTVSGDPMTPEKLATLPNPSQPWW